MTAPTAPGNQSEQESANNKSEGRLESWGEIAGYLGRDIRTVQRWEHDLGLPVQRLRTAKQGQVYASKAELDRWREQRAGKAVRVEGNGKTETGAEANGAGESPRQPDQSETRGSQWMVGVACVLGLIAMFWAFRPVAKDPQSAEVAKSQLFVRPLGSLSSAPEEVPFVQGLTNDLITQLGKADPESIVVFAPTTSAEYGKKTIPELRRELKTDYILEGSARRADDRLRIDVTLVAARDQKAVWTNSYTTDMKDVLRSQDDVVQDVVGQIRTWMAKVRGGDKGKEADRKNRTTAEKRETIDPGAYEAYVEGRLYWLDRDILRSRAAFEHALQRSPDFAPAQAGLAMVLLVAEQSPNDAVRPRDSVPQARGLARKALANDPTLGDAYCVLANIAQNYDYDSKEAEQLYQGAVKVDPASVTAHEWFGYYYLVHNRMAEAEMELNLALQLDPASLLINAQAAEMKYYRRDYEAALELAAYRVGNAEWVICSLQLGAWNRAWSRLPVEDQSSTRSLPVLAP
jgi:TolB-like protein